MSNEMCPRFGRCVVKGSVGTGVLVLAIAIAACAPASSQHPSAPKSEDSSTAQIASHPATATERDHAIAAEGLKVHYEVFGQGEPIVVVAGGLMDISGMQEVIGPLSRHRQVIGIDLEGHGRTALRKSPMSHERNGDDVAAVLQHLGIAKADIAGYSHGGDAAIRMAIQHPEMVLNPIVISTAASTDGRYPGT